MSIDAPVRIYAQYRNKPKAVAWYNITRVLSEELCEAAAVVRAMYDIDQMVGAQLDIIGRLVGQTRFFEALVAYDTTFFDDTGAECGEPGAECSPLTGEVDQAVSDEIYRLVLKLKIGVNNSDATFDSIIGVLTAVAPLSEPTIVDNEDYSFSVEFKSELTETQRFVFSNFPELIPRPQAVNFDGYTEVLQNTNYDGPFAYGAPGAQYHGN